MDIIFVSELRIETRIGVYEWERHESQTIQLDLEVGLPGQHSSRSDRLDDTIDYAAIVRCVESLFHSQRFSLLEQAAETVAETIRRDFNAPWVKVAIAKLAPLRGVKRLGVVIERGERPAHPLG